MLNAGEQFKKMIEEAHSTEKNQNSMREIYDKVSKLDHLTHLIASASHVFYNMEPRTLSVVLKSYLATLVQTGKIEIKE